MLDLEQLLQQAKAGELTPREIGLVEESLAEGLSGSDAYRALMIVGMVAAPARNTDVVARYLDDRDPTVAAQALHVLSDVWGRARDHRDAMLRLLRGIPGDEAGHATTQALNSAARYLHGTPEWDATDRQIFTAIIDVALDELRLPAQRMHAAVCLRNVMPPSPDENGRPMPGTSEFDRVILASWEYLGEGEH
ncbi:hypothetical protein HQ32_00826 [Prauserella sp. Am3]|nr:hypothetical protein HQ32_00826 [Prauserella sp. Am3]